MATTSGSGVDSNPQTCSARIEVASPTITVQLDRHQRSRTKSDQRLGVGDLLLWMTFACVDLAIVRARHPDAAGLAGMVWLSAHAAIAGLGWTGLCGILLRTVRTSASPIAPGHWLLGVLGLRLALEVVLGLQAGKLFASPSAVLAAVTCCALVLPTLDRKQPMIWKAMFGLLVAVHAAPLLGACLSVSFAGAAATLSPLLATASWARLIVAPSLPAAASLCAARDGLRYRGFHGLGIAAWIAWHMLPTRLLDLLL